jgi:Icc-related predicted phosphoesterase
MRKILACSGVNGDRTSLAKLVAISAERKPDAIMFAGGITNPDAAAPDRAKFMGEFFETMGNSGQLIVLIPGPQDVPLSEFFRLALNAEVSTPNVFVAHGSVYSKGEVAASGIGGKITASDDAANPEVRYSHTTAEYFLKDLRSSDKPIKILMLSEPPPGKLAGSEGNALVSEFIKSYHPALCIVAGKKADRGFLKESHGFVVNPGMLSESSAAWVDRPTRRVDMIDL